MNEIANKFLLAGDKFIPEMYLRQPRFAHSACWIFTKKKERIGKVKETGDSRYIYQNELDKACFQHDMAYGNIKDLTRRTASEHCTIKHLIVLKTRNIMDISIELLQWFTIFLIKKFLVVPLRL